MNRPQSVTQCASVDQSDRRVPINLRQSGATPVEMLISTRVRKSPYWHLSMEAGCWRATVYNRIYHPRGYVRPQDGGAMAEYDALVNHVSLWNVAVERQIQVKGPDAAAFVNYVITRDATLIKPMHGKYVILCNEDGGILNDPVLLRLAEDEYWFSLADSDLELWLRGVNVGLKYNVSIGEIDVAPVQIQGPKSEAIDGRSVWRARARYSVLRLDGRRSGWTPSRGFANWLHWREGLRNLPPRRHPVRRRPVGRTAQSWRAAPTNGHCPGASSAYRGRHPFLGSGHGPGNPAVPVQPRLPRCREKRRPTTSASKSSTRHARQWKQGNRHFAMCWSGSSLEEHR